MTAAKDLASASDLTIFNRISRDSGVTALDQSGCISLVYHYGNVWNNGVWNSFGSDLFDVRPSGNLYELFVSPVFYFIYLTSFV